MRCRNCLTVMMDTDEQCPSCHSSAARATAAPPGPISKPPGIALLLPMFGGAIGGALYAGLAIAAADGSSGGSRATGGSLRVKGAFGVLLLLGGGLFVLLACAHFWGTWTVVRREPTAATAADLCRPQYAAAAPAWLVHTFAESKPTDLTVTRSRLGHGGNVQARCLLVRVQDKWLVATVAPGFEGNNLVGRLLPVDSPSSQSLIERLQKRQPKPTVLLPYEFNAVDGSASDQRLRYTTAGCIAVFGVLGLSLGLYLLCGGPRAAQSDPTPATTHWAYRGLPSR
jgi:hypothetical protein